MSATSPTVSAIIDNLRSLNVSSLSNQDRAILSNELLISRRRLQAPFEVALDHGWAELSEVAAIKTLIDAGVFTLWNKLGNSKQTSKVLAEHCNMDSSMLNRLLLYLTSRGHFTRTIGKDEFELTPYTRNLSDSEFAELYTAYYEIQIPGFSAFPKHAKEVLKYHDHLNGDKNVWSTVQPDQENANLFTFITSTPIRNHAFGAAMSQYVGYQKSWIDLYPINEIVQDYQGNQPLLVDIGGSMGQDLKKLCDSIPQLPKGSLILQDLEAVIEDAKKAGDLPEAIETQAIDFFKSQPVHNARFYFMHSVLHDWSDSDANRILSKVKEAMTDPNQKRDFRPRLLIMEIILQDPPLPLALIADTTMMMHLAAAERTEDQWKSILEGAGFKITKVYSLPDSAYSVIECEVMPPI